MMLTSALPVACDLTFPEPAIEIFAVSVRTPLASTSPDPAMLTSALRACPTEREGRPTRRRTASRSRPPPNRQSDRPSRRSPLRTGHRSPGRPQSSRNRQSMRLAVPAQSPRWWPCRRYAAPVEHPAFRRGCMTRRSPFTSTTSRSITFSGPGRGNRRASSGPHSNLIRPGDLDSLERSDLIASLNRGPAVLGTGFAAAPGRSRHCPEFRSSLPCAFCPSACVLFAIIQHASGRRNQKKGRANRRALHASKGLRKWPD
jgi:hypothetical protein